MKCGAKGELIKLNPLFCSLAGAVDPALASSPKSQVWGFLGDSPTKPLDSEEESQDIYSSTCIRIGPPPLLITVQYTACPDAHRGHDC